MTSRYSRGWLAIAALLHLVAIASFYPELGLRVPSAVAGASFVGAFVLMSVSAVVLGLLHQDRRGLGLWVLGLGLGQFSITLLAVLDISLGPADPLALQDRFSPAIKLAWFVGFNAIAVMGCTFFLARPMVEIAQVVWVPLHRVVGLWAFAMAAVLGFALGMAAQAALHSESAQDLASFSNDPKAILVLIAIPLMLGALASALRR